MAINCSEVIIIIGCDVDPDKSPTGDEDLWRGINIGISRLKEEIKSTPEDVYPKITWFLRSDEQMNMMYDNYSYPVKQFWDIWKSLKAEGDELGWHPHLWDWNGERWFPHIADNMWIDKCMNNGYKALIKYFKPSSVRTGWDYQSNFIMKKLNDLGIRADLSAIPNHKNVAFASNNANYVFFYDWSKTGEEFYFPSTVDYRRMANGEESSLNILEMPQSMTPISLSRGVSKFLSHNMLHLLRNGLSRQIFPYSFHLTEVMRTTKNPKYFKPGVERKFKESRDKNCTSYIVSYFHPNELLQKGLFSIKNFELNLKILSDMSNKYEVPFRFLTAEEALEEYMRDVFCHESG